MGTYIKIQTVEPLWMAKHSHGVELQPFVDLEIFVKKLSTIDFKKSILIRIFVLPNKLILEHLFQSRPFEIDLFHADLFYMDEIFQTRP